jgi:DNA helicase HerA-like ATPase
MKVDTKQHHNHQDEAVIADPVPVSAVKAIASDAEAAGGAFQEPEWQQGRVGTTMFDMPSSKDGTLAVLMPQENIDFIPNQSLVRIKSKELDGSFRTYLGAVVEGPFSEPDGLKADATPLVVSATNGAMLLPTYHGRAQVEILGEEIDPENRPGVMMPPRFRPRPNSPVFPLDESEIADALKITGDIRLGIAEGFENLEVAIPNDRKVFPRHLGILGTTGGGKSTTVSCLIYEAQKVGSAVIIFDTEGEYCAINEETKEENMLAQAKRLGLKRSGVEQTSLYHLVGRETNNPGHPNVSEFSIGFNRLSPHAFKEILGLSDAQEERFFKAFDLTKEVLKELKIITPAQYNDAAMQVDEFLEGYPYMRLDHFYDVVAIIAAIVAKNDGRIYLKSADISSQEEAVRKFLNRQDLPKSFPSWYALQGKLNRLVRLGIFDIGQELDFEKLIIPGNVSIIDLSDTDDSKVRNLVIAELLRGVQGMQEEKYKKAVTQGKQPNQTLIFIEEAHEFLSRERISQMPILFSQVARIAKRGRKRKLGLVFITQLPQHLPNEVIGLINNWILHKIADASVINRLKQGIGGLNDTQWGNLKSLAPGQAICSFVSMARALQVSIDPTPSKLLMID